MSQQRPSILTSLSNFLRSLFGSSSTPPPPVQPPATPPPAASTAPVLTAEPLVPLAPRILVIVYDPVVDAIFKFSADEQTKYGSSNFGNSCLVARNLVKSNLGTHFVQIQHGGWDNHQDIYDKTTGIYGPAADLDNGLANLLIDLAAAPGTFLLTWSI